MSTTETGAPGDQIDTFAEAEALVDGVGPRPPGSDAERRAARHLAERLEAARPGGRGRAVRGLAGLGGRLRDQRDRRRRRQRARRCRAPRSARGSSCSPPCSPSSTSPASCPPRGGCSGGARRRTSSPGASANARARCCWSPTTTAGPRARWPLRPMFLALLVLLACCVLRVGGMSGTALTVLQFLPDGRPDPVRAAAARHRPLPRRARRERQRLGRRARAPARRAPRLARGLRRPRGLHRLAEGHGPGHAARSSRHTASSSCPTARPC